MNNPIKFVYFGGEPLGVPVLDMLATKSLYPTLVVCNPDRPAGRGQQLTSPPVKVWAETNGITVFQPTSYGDDTVRGVLASNDYDLFVVVAYNFILPQWLLQIPHYGTINVHPSLLPKLRGASPIRTAILRDQPESVGITIMLMDAKMDHGPILKQERLTFTEHEWPIKGPRLDLALAELGGKVLSETIPAWIAGEITPQDQDHTIATYSQKLHKKDGELLINPLKLPVGDAGRHAWLVINAFSGIGDAFFLYKGKRVKINQAKFLDQRLQLLRVTVEGKKEMSFSSFLQSVS